MTRSLTEELADWVVGLDRKAVVEAAGDPARRCLLDTPVWASRRYMPRGIWLHRRHINAGFIDQHLFTADRAAIEILLRRRVVCLSLADK